VVSVNTSSGVHIRIAPGSLPGVERVTHVFASALLNEKIAAFPAFDPKNIPIANVIVVMVGAKP
jgi:hypothetical protein